MSNYQVLFSGEIVEGAQEAVVRQNMARGLGLDVRKVNQLFSGRTVVVRSQMSQEEAFRLQSQLADFGAVVRVKDLSLDDRAKYKLDTRESDRTMKDITAAHQECPRCGHLQLETAFCARCGVDIAAANKQKRKEDLLIEKKIRDMRRKRHATAGSGRSTSSSAKSLADTLVEPSGEPETAIEIRTEPREPRNPFGGKGKSWLSRLKGG